MATTSSLVREGEDPREGVKREGLGTGDVRLNPSERGGQSNAGDDAKSSECFGAGGPVRKGACPNDGRLNIPEFVDHKCGGDATVPEVGVGGRDRS